MKKHCFTLDLIEDPKLIAEYKMYHKNIWPEITKSLVDSGIEALEIYCLGNRLFMIMEVNNSFSFERKTMLDANNSKVLEWEALMWKYQKALPIANEGEKWMLMEKIYEL